MKVISKRIRWITLGVSFWHESTEYNNSSTNPKVPIVGSTTFVDIGVIFW